MVCTRCGLVRPEKFGRGWRCACCGLVYPQPPAIADPGLLERKLWCWWWVDVTPIATGLKSPPDAKWHNAVCNQLLTRTHWRNPV